MVFRRIERRFISSFDWPIIICVFCLGAIGMLGVFSAGYDYETKISFAAQRQGIAFAVGLLGFLFGVFVNTAFWRRIAFPLYGLCLVMLVGILFLGIKAGGARSWFDFGGFRLQPSEMTKLAVILVLARILSSEHAPRDGYTLKKLFVPALVFLFPFLLILKQPDLGTGVNLLLIVATMILVAGVRVGTLARLVVVGLLLIYPAWHTLEPYQQERIINLYSPERDPQGSGYNALQSKIAVGSGSIAGKGFLQGTQTQLRFLPEQTTDFIFSVLAEEWGFVGSIAILGLYSYLIFRILRIAMKSSDGFAAFVSVGVAALVFWEMFLNIGMVIGILPVVGLTLPLLSYGGSSLVTVLLGVGIVTGFSIRRFMFA